MKKTFFALLMTLFCSSLFGYSVFLGKENGKFGIARSVADLVVGKEIHSFKAYYCQDEPLTAYGVYVQNVINKKATFNSKEMRGLFLILSKNPNAMFLPCTIKNNGATFDFRKLK